MTGVERHEHDDRLDDELDVNLVDLREQVERERLAGVRERVRQAAVVRRRRRRRARVARHAVRCLVVQIGEARLLVYVVNDAARQREQQRRLGDGLRHRVERDGPYDLADDDVDLCLRFAMKTTSPPAQSWYNCIELPSPSIRRFAFGGVECREVF